MEHTPLILDGKKAQGALVGALQGRVKKLERKPKLVIVRVGKDERSSVYIRRKIAFGESVGVEVVVSSIEEKVTEEEAIKIVQDLNNDRSVSGIIIQLPLPAHLSEKTITAEVAPEKDVDGLTPYNLGLLARGELGGFIPATAKGVLALLSFYNISVAGKNVVVVGRSPLVGRPLAMLFLAYDATVTIAHRKTKNLSEITKNADIIIGAAGTPHLIGKDMVRPGCVVVDIGTTPVRNGESTKLAGDVSFDEVSRVVSAISPVPGGVGPMTVYALFENIVTACEKQV